MVPSLAVHETVVVPRGNIEPDGGEHETVGDPSTASVAVTVKDTNAPPEPPAGTVIVAGTETTGAVVS